MTKRLAVVVGAGKLAAGWLAPTLVESGWQVTMVSRSPDVVSAVRRGRGVELVIGGANTRTHVSDISAVGWDDPRLPGLVAAADLVLTSVGPDALPTVGGKLAALLANRFQNSIAPLNVITFENHRRAPELLAGGMLHAEPRLASLIGRRLGLSGGAAWTMVSRREAGPDGLVLHRDSVEEAYVDGAALLRSVAPLDGSVPPFHAVEPFDAWMVEKLWVLNAGHACAAYLGRQRGCGNVGEAMRRPDVHTVVRAVVAEAVFALALAAPARRPRNIDDVLARYTNDTLADPVSRVARDPRRKLAPGDRLIGPALACLAGGQRPAALVAGIAAALAYRDATDQQSQVLARELALVGPEEVLAIVCALEPSDELSRAVCAAYREHGVVELAG